MFTWPRSAQSESDEFQHNPLQYNCMNDHAMDARTADFLDQTVSVLERSQSAYRKHQRPDRQKGRQQAKSLGRTGSSIFNLGPQPARLRHDARIQHGPQCNGWSCYLLGGHIMLQGVVAMRPSWSIAQIEPSG